MRIYTTHVPKLLTVSFCANCHFNFKLAICIESILPHKTRSTGHQNVIYSSKLQGFNSVNDLCNLHIILDHQVNWIWLGIIRAACISASSNGAWKCGMCMLSTSCHLASWLILFPPLFTVIRPWLQIHHCTWIALQRLLAFLVHIVKILDSFKLSSFTQFGLAFKCWRNFIKSTCDWCDRERFTRLPVYHFDGKFLLLLEAKTR